MAVLLRTLLVFMILGLLLTTASAHRMFNLQIDHIMLSIFIFLYTIFVQAFIMFYFIGVSRLVQNIVDLLLESKSENLQKLFDNPPRDLAPYVKKSRRSLDRVQRYKRKNIPWTMLILTLGTIAFLLGGAHDTNLVSRSTHAGVVYGFLMAVLIGSYKAWHLLQKCHLSLRELKILFEIPIQKM